MSAKNEIAQLRAQLAEQRAILDTPSIKAMVEFDEQHARRVTEGRKLVADEAKRQAEYDAAHPPQQWVRLEARDKGGGGPVFRTDEVTHEIAAFPNDVEWFEIDLDTESVWVDTEAFDPSANGTSACGSWQRGPARPVERRHAMARSGHDLVLASELESRISRSGAAKTSPTLADLIKSGELICTVLTIDEARVQERRLRSIERAVR